jgi:hypothetical protein
LQAILIGGGSARIRLWRSITSRWVAIGLQSKSVERAQDRRPWGKQRVLAKVDLEPLIPDEHKGHEGEQTPHEE